MLGGCIKPLSNFGEQLGIEPKPDAGIAIKFIVSEFTSTQKSVLPLHYCSHVAYRGLEPRPPDSKSGILTIELMGRKKST